MPKVSIIIPVYNGAKFVKDAIESVLAQTYKDYEIIVVNDGSTDNTEEVLRPYIDKGLIRYFYQENKGVSAARNKGINEARGEYVAFLDADDVWLPEFLHSIFSTCSNFEFAFTDNYRDEVDTAGNILRRDVQKRDVDLAKDLFQQFLVRDRIGSPNKIVVKRDFILLNQIMFEEKLASREDWDYCLQVLRFYPKVCYVDKPLVIYRIRLDGTNSTRKMGNAWIDYTLFFMHKWKKFYMADSELRKVYANHLWDLARKYFYNTPHKLKSLTCALESIFTDTGPFVSFLRNIKR